MTGPTLFMAFCEALWAVALAAFAEAPLLWTMLIGAVAALTMCSWDLLEHRGLRAAAWGMTFAVLFAVWLALAPHYAADASVSFATAPGPTS